MGKTFGKVKVCLSGDFGPKAEKVRQWVEANGGRLSKHVDTDVTHLITTKDAFRKPTGEGIVNALSKTCRITFNITKTLTVREARRIKGIKIVSIDWLEDSLLSKSRRPKREGPYLWSHVVKDGKRKKAEKRHEGKEPAIAVTGMLSVNRHKSTLQMWH